MANETQFIPGFQYTLERGEVIRVYGVHDNLVEGSITCNGTTDHFCLHERKLKVAGEGVDCRIDPSKTYITKSGYSVRILATDVLNDRPLVCAVSTGSGRELVLSYHLDGRQYRTIDDDEDLVEVPPVSYEPDEVVQVLEDWEWTKYHYRGIQKDRRGSLHSVWDEGRSSSTARSEDAFFCVDDSKIRKLK